MALNPHAFFTSRKVVFLLATFCCLLWGSAYPAIKNGYAQFNIAVGDIPAKMVFAGYRFMFAGLVLLLLATLMGRKGLNPGWASLGRFTLLGLTQTSLSYIFFYTGLAYTTGVKGSIMNSTSTFFGVLLAHLLYRNDRLNVNKTLGCLIGFLGVMAVNFSPDLLDFNFTLIGEGFVVIAALIQAVGFIYGKKLSQQVDSFVLTGYQLAIGGLVLVLAGYATGGTLSGFTVASTALMIYMILLSSVAFLFWTLLLKYNPVGMISVFNFLIPIFGALLSAIFLGESIMELKNLIALALVCSGIWLVSVKGNRQAPSRANTR